MIPINPTLHRQIKEYCAEQGLIMSKFVEGLICTTFKRKVGEDERRDIRSNL
jgi:hypothetical protein